MKKFILLAILVALMVAPAIAQDTGDADWKYLDGTWLDHNHSYQDTHADLNIHQERDMEWGGGVDVAIPITENFTVEAQNKFDMGNQEYSGYLVGKLRFDVFGVDKK